jgi:putative ABC transport system substrate-binding protein
VKRREVIIKLLGGVLAAWPLAARTQQPGKLKTIGFLGTITPAVQIRWTDAFVQRLRELGWIEGRTIAIEFRAASAPPRLLPSSSGRKWMLLLPGGRPNMFLRQSRRHRRSCSRM